MLVIERTVAAGEDLAAFTAMDLRMLILGTGRERTLDEYTALAGRAGWRVASVTPTAVGPHVIELTSPPPDPLSAPGRGGTG